MTDQTTTDQPADAVHEHVFEDRWYPLDRATLRRVCVLPDCHHVETKAAIA